ncbi:uncharacterized protein PITG_12938 [Phytophthora infestans T30-4]|uniref:Tc1-like transposase DDE domain-containing protein n=1 Tax=Phytophthora infestans (strain T30-4) TaxID=403677 RepID=D0NJX0_PHYIT|nr:uncharacterized protein PITG_12938 [Phytophthora infestans T30-4]EEY59807.1 conserved hypothetical protein [Phytophthora infestans T30-4]|eukprot:XP_002900492.1 conserved hypothetical protein [Phytophthora infestans T30-4]
MKGPVKKAENARFMADLFIAALRSEDPMLNPIEGCWNSLKAKMRHFMMERKHEFLVRGEYDSFTAHRLQLMKDAVEACKNVITRRLIWRYERHCLRHCFAAEKGFDMELGA